VHLVGFTIETNSTSFREGLNSAITRVTVIYRVAQKERMFFISARDFFLWGYLKSKVYDLKVSIREEIATVPQKMLVNVMQNLMFLGPCIILIVE